MTSKSLPKFKAERIGGIPTLLMKAAGSDVWAQDGQYATMREAQAAAARRREVAELREE